MTSAEQNPLEQLTLSELRQRTSQKWQAHGGDLLPLWVAEMDVLLAEPIATALHRAVRTGDTGYSANAGYAEAVAAFAAQRWGWQDFPVGRTRVLADVMTGIVEVLRVSTDPGDHVVVTSPVYAPFFSYVGHAGRRVVETALTAAGRLDVAAVDDALAAAATAGRRAVVLISNPHNPTGTVHTRDELASLAAVATRRGVRVLSDEIHGPLVLAGATFTPYLTVPGTDDAIAFTSASKGWNLAGVKAALAIAGPAAADALRHVPAELDYAPSHLGVIAHTAAFGQSSAWLDALLVGLGQNRALLAQLLVEHLPQVRWTPPEGTYLAWLDCSALAVPRTEHTGEFAVATDIDGPARHFFDRAHVALNSGHIFGRGGEGHVRMNFATSTEILTTALTRMGAATPR